MRIPIADGRLMVTRCAITFRAIACSRVASRATIEPAKPWVTRTSPASAAPIAAELHADRVRARRADAAPLDEHVLGLQRRRCPPMPDLDLVGGRLADPAALDARRAADVASGAGAGSSDGTAVDADGAVMGTSAAACVRGARRRTADAPGRA